MISENAEKPDLHPISIELDGQPYSGTYRVMSGSVIVCRGAEIKYASYGSYRPPCSNMAVERGSSHVMGESPMMNSELLFAGSMTRFHSRLDCHGMLLDDAILEHLLADALKTQTRSFLWCIDNPP